MIKPILVSLILLFGLTGPLHAMPPEVKLERYLSEGKKAIEEEDYEKALSFFSRAQALKLPLGEDFNFFLGKAEVRGLNPFLGQTHLYLYTKSSGKEGVHYQEALELMQEAVRTAADQFNLLSSVYFLDNHYQDGKYQHNNKSLSVSGCNLEVEATFTDPDRWLRHKWSLELKEAKAVKLECAPHSASKKEDCHVKVYSCDPLVVNHSETRYQLAECDAVEKQYYSSATGWHVSNTPQGVLPIRFSTDKALATFYQEVITLMAEDCGALLTE